VLNEWWCSRPEGGEGVKWTLRQMELAGEGRPGTWEEYLHRESPWFAEK
jgi:hypothetical protein